MAWSATMKNYARLLVLLAALVFTLSSTGVVSAASPGDGRGRSKHEETIAYWTPERVGRAKPREVSPAEQHEAVAPLKPGKGGPGGGGGGGGSTSSVTGASWTKGGLVKQTVGKVLFTMGGVDYV
jgi:hypothetical protein